MHLRPFMRCRRRHGGLQEGSGRLYISVQPAASPELQALVRELWPLVQSISRPGTPSAVLDVLKGGFDIGMLESESMQSLPISPLSAVHLTPTLFNLLAALSTPREQGKSQPRFRDELKALPAKLDYLLKAASKDVGQFSDVELLGLYYTVDEAHEGRFTQHRFFRHEKARGPSEGRQTHPHRSKERALLQPLAGVPSSSSNIQLRDQFGRAAHEIVIRLPPEELVEDPETPRCFTGSAVVHPDSEAALLGYACDSEHKVDMWGYVGASSPTCYPCFMLLYALAVGLGASGRSRYSVGVSQCSFCIPLPWCPPPGMDGDALQKFGNVLTEDYLTTVRQENAKMVECYNVFWLP
ncbi:hypothetical protein GSI_14232 [Ganoderma sinense ZZ0214-1]|uniref:Uncharacterized protein n=1 Tax=Ganoderma sinense ZZ0214-1 TaxID=1077348 RepID=A0A2G8RT05_9APHY|nr:hypothetical protein GSI_14232 [Ganoderma sinense ZZ0214-1]